MWNYQCISRFLTQCLILMSIMFGMSVKELYAERTCQEVADRALDQWYLKYIKEDDAIKEIVSKALSESNKEASEEDKQAKFKEQLIQKFSGYLYEQINIQKAIPGCTKSITKDEVKNLLFSPKEIKDSSQAADYALSGVLGLGSATIISGVVAAYGVLTTGVVATVAAGGASAVAYSWFTGPVVASALAAGAAVSAGAVYMFKKSAHKEKIKDYCQKLKENFLDNKEKLRVSLRQVMNQK